MLLHKRVGPVTLTPVGKSRFCKMFSHTTINQATNLSSQSDWSWPSRKYLRKKLPNPRLPSTDSSTPIPRVSGTSEVFKSEDLAAGEDAMELREEIAHLQCIRVSTSI